MLAASAGAEAFGLATGAFSMAFALFSLLVATPERMSRRLTGTRSEATFRRVARWSAQARGFWVLIFILALTLPVDIGRVFSVHDVWPRLGYVVFPVVEAVVIVMLLRLRRWAKARPETSFM